MDMKNDGDQLGTLLPTGSEWGKLDVKICDVTIPTDAALWQFGAVDEEAYGNSCRGKISKTKATKLMVEEINARKVEHDPDSVSFEIAGQQYKGSADVHYYEEKNEYQIQLWYKKTSPCESQL